MAAVLPSGHPVVSQKLTDRAERQVLVTARTHTLDRMARWIESWLPGASPAADGPYPGERLGLPASGVSSVAGLGRRAAALAIDWLLGYGIAALLAGPGALADPNLGWYVLGVWYLLTAVPVAVFGASAGMTALGIRVASLDSAAVVGVPRALLRTALIALVLPPLARDEDGRGWHDRAGGAVVVRSRA
jgi:uncharacterized RDD family membrane protein YckC